VFWIGVSPFVVIVGAAIAGAWMMIRNRRSHRLPPKEGMRNVTQAIVVFMVLVSSAVVGLYLR